MKGAAGGQSSGAANLLVAVTGASGAIYGERLLRATVAQGLRVGLVITPEAAGIAAHELGWGVDFDKMQVTGLPPEVEAAVRHYHPDDLSARYASGSGCPDAMVVIPCSMGAAGRMAAGLGNTLITRAAAVCLKERRPLVLVVREAPLSLIDLRNLAALAEAGACIMPAAPPFYARPTTIEEMVDYFVIRVLDQIGIHLEHPGRWGG
jgi:4-hydroxy-3-polyprenylbenzoate decarboxylase